jgi:hypothetical protein
VPTATPSPGRRGRYEVLERTDPVRAEGPWVTDCEFAPANCGPGAADTVRAVVARRTGCDERVPVQYFERGLVVLSELVVEPPYDTVAFPPDIHDRLRVVAPRSVPAAGFDSDLGGDAIGSTIATDHTPAESIPVYAQAVFREGAESGITPDWADSCRVPSLAGNRKGIGWGT